MRIAVQESGSNQATTLIARDVKSPQVGTRTPSACASLAERRTVRPVVLGMACRYEAPELLAPLVDGNYDTYFVKPSAM